MAYKLSGMKLIPVVLLSALCATFVLGEEPPGLDLSNGVIHLKLYLPNAKNGFYRGTRFDWSGVIYSLEAHGHNYYGPWFQRTSPSVHDFVYEGQEIVAGPCSAVTGPVDEFGPVGWQEAKPGGTFIKIGVGALRKTDAPKYDNYYLYEIADQGKWSTRKTSNSIEFLQELQDGGSGYGYTYGKTLRLAQGKPEMVLIHRLKNTGKRAIHTTVYNHNFLTLDGKGPGSGLSVEMPFPIKTEEPFSSNLAEIRGNRLLYRTALKDRDVVATHIQGFGSSPSDNRIRIEDSHDGAGMTIDSDRPLSRLSLWSIRTVVAVEPFIKIDVEPGQEFTWQSTYRYDSH